MFSWISHRRHLGFTLIELTVSIFILSLLAVFSGRIYLNYLDASRNIKAGNLLYEEARFLMEKIVWEIRQNAIDYEQYFNENVMIPYNKIALGMTGTYTDNYCSYSSFFYDSGKDGDPNSLNDNKSTGLRNPEREALYTGAGLDITAVRPIENELYLINLAGNKRTILTRQTKNVDGVDIGKASMLQLDGADYGTDHINGKDSYNGLKLSDPNCQPDDRENDGLTDSWFCSKDFPCKHDVPIQSTTVPACEGYRDIDPLHPLDGFIDISPSAINVTNLRFLIAPSDDPWKAYGINSVQIQPHVTIQMTVEANPRLASTVGNRLPSITLSTTITTRNYDEVKSDCQ